MDIVTPGSSKIKKAVKNMGAKGLGGPDNSWNCCTYSQEEAAFDHWYFHLIETQSGEYIVLDVPVRLFGKG